MPEMRLYLDAEQWLYEVDALMAFPLEEKSREQLAVLNKVDAKLQRSRDDWVRVKSDLLRQLLTIESVARVRELAAEQKRQGRRTGHILIALAMLALTGQDASLNKAMYLLPTLYRQFPEVFADDRAVDERHVKSTWMKFRSVAHLWAACEALRLQRLGADAPIRVEFVRRRLDAERERELAACPELAVHVMSEEQRQRLDEQGSPEPLPWEPQEAALVIGINDLPEMLQLGAWFLDFGANHVSRHQHSKQPTLKRDDMWTFSAIQWAFPVEVSAPAFPEWAAASLKSYPKRHLPV